MIKVNYIFHTMKYLQIGILKWVFKLIISKIRIKSDSVYSWYGLFSCGNVNFFKPTYFPSIARVRTPAINKYVLFGTKST